jgi:hypothetical protein
MLIIPRTEFVARCRDGDYLLADVDEALTRGELVFLSEKKRIISRLILVDGEYTEVSVFDTKIHKGNDNGPSSDNR